MNKSDMNTLKVAYKAYANALLESDQHWQLESWEELCQQPEKLKAWRAALAVITKLTAAATVRKFTQN